MSLALKTFPVPNLSRNLERSKDTGISCSDSIGYWKQ